VEFAELEYRPSGVKQAHTGIRSKSWDEIEMEAMKMPTKLESKGRMIQRSPAEQTGKLTNFKAMNRKVPGRSNRMIEWYPTAPNQAPSLESVDEEGEDVNERSKVDMKEIV
jgi:hypothetical protein